MYLGCSESHLFSEVSERQHLKGCHQDLEGYVTQYWAWGGVVVKAPRY